MTPLRALTPRGHGFLWLGLVAVLAGIALGYPDVTRVGLVLALLPALTLVFARRRSPELAVRRTVEPQRLTVGRDAVVLATFTNVGRRRTAGYLATESLPRPLGQSPRFLLPAMSVGDDFTVRYPVHGHLRGAYRVGPLGLRYRDALGLTYVAVRLSSTSEVLVLPQRYPLASGAALALAGGDSGELPTRHAQHGEADPSIRNYRDGDELRRVHWPATAHRGELMVRQTERPAQRTAVLLLDSRSSAYAGSHPEVFEFAVAAAASIGTMLINQGLSLHLVTAETVHSGEAATAVGEGALLDTLARVALQPQSGLSDLAGAAQTLASGGAATTAVIFDYDRTDMGALAHLGRAGQPGRALILSQHDAPDPLGKPTAGVPPSLGPGWQVAHAGPHTPLEKSWSLVGGGP